ncbi:cysteine-rich receptor-like protein kinase [Tanacetum coccineum]|uniref:Cysteine-rich receptor-like protein kinase n=1 Tax=Tanacetum coccineum TaxID=301880 RepID=A0ABQ5GJ10_9ASTR
MVTLRWCHGGDDESGGVKRLWWQTEEGEARGGEWVWGSNRSGDEEKFFGGGGVAVAGNRWPAGGDGMRGERENWWCVISSIIGPNQTAFLSERQILDGCLTANELIHMAKIEDHKLFLLKVDFEKAFDSVCWNFLLDIMTHMGFGDKWRQWISFCLCSASISTFINSSPSKEFKMERGLR